MTHDEELSPEDEALSEALWAAVHEGLTAGVEAPDAVAAVLVVAGKMLADAPEEHRDSFFREAMHLVAYHAGYAVSSMKVHEGAVQ